MKFRHLTIYCIHSEHDSGSSSDFMALESGDDLDEMLESYFEYHSKDRTDYKITKVKRLMTPHLFVNSEG